MLAIIPARGGSKGLPGKNIKKFCGKPLIAHTIAAAQKSRSVDRIVVSTDDQEIAAVAQKHGAEIPFMRPKSLATDNALALDVYIYTLERLNSEFRGKYKDFIVLLPTVPLRTSSDIDKAVQLFKRKKADSVISVTEAPYPPLWARRVKSGVLKPYFDRLPEGQNRQEEADAYIPNGAIFILKLKLLKEKRSYYSNKTYPYLMPRERSVDIDDVLDFKIAEFLKHDK